MGDISKCHKIFTINTFPSLCFFTDQCQALNSHLWFLCWVEKHSCKDRRMDRHGHPPPPHTPSWLVLTCKHFWNFPGYWARTDPVSEELYQDFCLPGDSETPRIGDHPVKGEKSLKSYVYFQKNIAFSSDTSSRWNNRFHFTPSHNIFFTTVLSPERAELSSLCALPREDRVTELLILHCPVFRVAITMIWPNLSFKHFS